VVIEREKNCYHGRDAARIFEWRTCFSWFYDLVGNTLLGQSPGMGSPSPADFVLLPPIAIQHITLFTQKIQTLSFSTTTARPVNRKRQMLLFRFAVAPTLVRFSDLFQLSISHISEREHHDIKYLF
jgi:hypothetical protein